MNLKLRLFLLFVSAIAHAQNGPTPVQYRPYTAVEKVTFVQKLTNGITITRETTITMVRDSQGRTRREETVPVFGGRSITHIHVLDPSAHTTTSWSSQNKQATRFHIANPQLPPTTPPAPGFGTAANGSVVSSSSAVLVAGPVLSGGAGVGIAGSRSDPNLKPTFKREKLEGKTIAGAYAEGTRLTTTFPINSLGNDQPLSIVTDTWTSADLNLTLYAVTDDPRSGTQTTEVTSLDRNEPDPVLFEPPAGYEVKDIAPPTPTNPN